MLLDKLQNQFENKSTVSFKSYFHNMINNKKGGDKKIKNKKIKSLLGITLAFVMLLGSTQLIFAEEDKQYKAPLRQIRDDGVTPQDIKCNADRVLFFNISTGFPVCIYERSIDRFDNTQIGWHGLGSPFFIELSDREYLDNRNSNLERNVFVNYKIDANNNVIYNFSEEITQQEKPFLVHNVIFNDEIFDRNIKGFLNNDQTYSIEDIQGRDPVDWNDPRTSIITKSSSIEDYGLLYPITCNEENSLISTFKLNEEASFKILDGVESVHIRHPDKILTNYSETDKEIKDFFWSQGKTKFSFDIGLKEVAISEYSCISSLTSVSYLYEITFEVVN